MTTDTDVFPQSDQERLLWASVAVVDLCCCCRHGQALDLQDDYMASRHDADKENAHQQSNVGKDNWPEVEIRVAGKTAGKALLMLFRDSLHPV